MRLVYTENVHALLLPKGHAFPLGKYDRILSSLRASYPELVVLGAPAARDDLALVHDVAFLDRVRAGTMTDREVRRLGFPWSDSLAQRATRSVGGTLAALEWALATGAAGHMAGGTHHAFRDRGEGYCTFNDIAVAVEVARRDHGVRRVAIVDLDVHQGNGTAAIFAGDDDVFTLSLHGRRNYPFVKERSRRDVELADGCDDATYLAALGPALEEVEGHRPEVIFFQSGVDTLGGDRLGRTSLTLEGLRARDRAVFALAEKLHVPLVVTLGGGYGRDIDRTIRGHVQVFEGLVDAFGRTR